jgi:hypothetical protein
MLGLLYLGQALAKLLELVSTESRGDLVRIEHQVEAPDLGEEVS